MAKREVIVRAMTPLRLRNGSGGHYLKGLCAMEAVAWLSNEAVTDEPKRSCPLLSRFMMRLNDTLDDANRQKLLPSVLGLVNSRSQKHELRRMKHLVFSVARNLVAPALVLDGFPDKAKKVASARTFNRLIEVTSFAGKHFMTDARDQQSYAAAKRLQVCAVRGVEYSLAIISTRREVGYDKTRAFEEAEAAIKSAGGAAVEAAAYASRIKGYRQLRSAYSVDDAPSIHDLVSVLNEAIQLGPNGLDSANLYIKQATSLGVFANEKLGHEVSSPQVV